MGDDLPLQPSALKGGSVRRELIALGDRFRPRDENIDAFVVDWERFLPLGPLELFEMLSLDLEGQTRIVRAYFEGVGLTFEFSLCVDGELVMEAERHIDFANDLVRHDALMVYPPNQQRHFGSVFLRNSEAVYSKIGIGRIVLNVGNENGGFVWARLGFVPDEWQVLREEIRQRYQVLRHLVDADTAEVVETILAGDDPLDLYDLANIHSTVDDVKLGARLLNGTKWHGTLDRQE